jgi:hypothetical protein
VLVDGAWRQGKKLLVEGCLISKSASAGGVGCLYLDSKSVPAVGVGYLSGNGYYALPLFAQYPTCGNICTPWRVCAICGCLDDYTVLSLFGTYKRRRG